MPTPEDGSSPGRRPPSPPPIDHLVDAFAAVPADPQPGQLWRARWQRTAQVVVLLGADRDTADAAPFTPDVAVAAGVGVVVEAKESPLRSDHVAWTPLARPLPVRVLDIVVGTVTDEALDRVRRGPRRPVELHPLDERSQVVERIAERMDDLEHARWVPDVAEPVDLAALMRGRGLTPGRLATKLEVEPGEIMDIVRGDRAPSLRTAEKLAPALGLDVAALTGPRPVDADLVRALDQPRFRRRLAERGRQAGVDDEAAWRYQVATSELAAAARTTGHADAYRRFVGLIEDYLR